LIQVDLVKQGQVGAAHKRINHLVLSIVAGRSLERVFASEDGNRCCEDFKPTNYFRNVLDSHVDVLGSSLRVRVQVDFKAELKTFEFFIGLENLFSNEEH